jgi:hypothetical protein
VIFEMAMAGLVGAATAQAAETVPLGETAGGAPAVEPSVAGPELRIPAKTVVQIAIAEPISSKVAQIGDSFAISLAEPLTVGDRVIIPAGVVGRGEVTHAAKSGWGGKAGELIVNARHLQCGDLRIPLGHFQYAGTGKDNFGGAFVAAQVIPLGQFMVNGGEASIPAGVRGTAKVKADVVLTAEALRGCMKPAE